MKNRKSPEDLEEKLMAELFRHIYRDSFSKLITEFSKKDELYPLFFKNLPDLHTTLNTNRKCCFEYCGGKTVGSHLFQEAILRKYSKNGFLLVPDLNLTKKKTYLKSISVTNALKFSGFCLKHEAFFTYEKKSKLEYVRDFKLFIYKTLCYDYVITHEIINKLRIIKEGLFKIRDEKMKAFFQDGVNKIFPNAKIEVTKINSPKHIVETDFKNKISKSRNRLKEINVFRKLIYSDWKNKKNNKSESIKTFIIPLPVIPIFFSYYGDLTMKTSDGFEFFKTLTSVIIHPFDNSTYIFLSCHKKDFKKLKSLKNYLIADVNNVYQFIGMCLVFVGDNWLINEDFYKSQIPTGLKKAIEKSRGLPAKPQYLSTLRN